MRRMWMVLLSIVIVILIAVPGGREAGIAPAAAQSRELAAPASPVIEESISEAADVADAADPVKEAKAKAKAISAVEKAESRATLAASSARKPTTASVQLEKEKVVYLTFDDGPSKLTDEILSILEEQQIKATFFVLGEHARKSPEIIYRTAEAGHVIGNHTYNHEYNALYESFTAFWGQIKETEEILREITGSRTSLVRAPGGTYGHFDSTYFQMMEAGGYQVFDWNVDSGDSRRKGVPASEIVENVTSQKLENEMIVLMHDSTGHEQTVKALPDIIAFYKQKGYSFEVLSPGQRPVQFSLSKKVPARAALASSWIETHVLPNAALFGPAQPLYVEAGGVQTKLAAGEYSVDQGQLMVPLRTTLERLGAEVSWDAGTRNVKVVWGDIHLTLDPERGTALREEGHIPLEIGADRFRSQGGSLWMSLRSLLELSDHPIISVTNTAEERRVQSL